jgi:hypothetical protein
MEVQTQNYLAKNEAGEILFKIELSQIEAFPWLRFSCSLDIDFEKQKRLLNSIEQLCSTTTTPEAKAKLLQDIIQQIKRIEGVEKFYFQNRKPDEAPEVKNGIQELLNYIFAQDDFKEFVPFSINNNSYFFRELENNLAPPHQLPELLEVEKECFEDLIKNHKRLEEEYIEHYSPAATFFARAIWYGDVCYEFYFMKTDRIVLIFFMESL